jgi:hypothetical protein
MHALYLLNKARLIGFLIISYSFVLLLEGCALFPHYDQLMMLKKIGENENDIKNYVNKQEHLFLKLREDVKNNRLAKGVPKEEVLFHYGSPIFCRSSNRQGPIKEFCLYRRPVEYFNTDVIYLRFDKYDNLYSWEFIPASSKP